MDTFLYLSPYVAKTDIWSFSVPALGYQVFQQSRQETSQPYSCSVFVPIRALALGAWCHSINHALCYVKHLPQSVLHWKKLILSIREIGASGWTTGTKHTIGLRKIKGWRCVRLLIKVKWAKLRPFCTRDRRPGHVKVTIAIVTIQKNHRQRYF